MTLSLMCILLCLAVGYVCGNLPSGYLYSKSQGVDIFKVGSGNPGSTNISRTFGKKAGATVLLLDIAKTIVPILLMHFILKPENTDLSTLVILYTGLGAIIGHCFPLPLIPDVHGGKGVACFGACVIAFDYRMAVVLLLFFILIVKTTGYVSLGSCLGVTAFAILTAVLGWYHLLYFSHLVYMQVVVLGIVMALIIIWQHRANIQRLMNGTETKFRFKK